VQVGTQILDRINLKPGQLMTSSFYRVEGCDDHLFPVIRSRLRTGSLRLRAHPVFVEGFEGCRGPALSITMMSIAPNNANAVSGAAFLTVKRAPATEDSIVDPASHGLVWTPLANRR